MANETNKPQEQPQGYTADDLNNDIAAGVANEAGGSQLAHLNDMIAQVNADIARLEAETAQALNNPLSIPVPEDFRANPLMAIGAGLRAVGGDTSSLDSLLARKQVVADQQRAIAAQNIAIENRFRHEQRTDLRRLLEGKRETVERASMIRAGLIDSEAKTAEERRFAGFEASVGQLGMGTTAEQIAQQYPQEMKDSGYDLDMLLTMQRAGEERVAASQQAKAPTGSKGMFAQSWEEAYGPSFDAQVAAIAAGGLSAEELQGRLDDVMTDILLIESQSEGGQAKREQYMGRVREALVEGGMADAAAQKAAKEAAAFAEVEAARRAAQNQRTLDYERGFENVFQELDRVFLPGDPVRGKF